MNSKPDSYKEALPKIRELTRGWGCYYPEIRILVHPFSTRITYLFARIGIAPNFVTYIGTIFSVACIWFFYHEQYAASFLSYAIRLILDYTDGSLARYTKTFSNFGAKLDLICDYIFYVPFWIVVCFKLEILTFILQLLLAASIYVIVIDYFVEPRLKTLSRRASLKQFFINKGIILGFSPFGILELWSIVFFAINIPTEYYTILPLLVSADLLYRVYEIIKYGEK